MIVKKIPQKYFDYVHKECAKISKEFKNLGDIYDPRSSVYKDPGKFIDKIDVALYNTHRAQENARQFVEQYTEKVYRGEVLFEKELWYEFYDLNSACIEEADFGILLGSSIEAMNLYNWPDRIRARVFRFFLKIAQSTAEHESYYALAKASGVLMAIADSHPRGQYDAEEIAYYRGRVETFEDECRGRLYSAENPHEARVVSLDCHKLYKGSYDDYKVLEEGIIHRFEVPMN